MNDPLPISESRRSQIDCRGTFEAHLTVEAPTLEEQRRFLEVCKQLGIKAILIELAHGTHPAQPMTSSYHQGYWRSVLPEIEALRERLSEARFLITRIKVEAVATNEGIPQSAAETASFPTDCYFEFHAKLLLKPDEDHSTLQAICERHQARLSRNARRMRADGMIEQFVTQRIFRAGRVEAYARFDRLLADLAETGYVVLNQQREYTLFDSAAGLDAGWIEPEGAVG